MKGNSKEFNMIELLACPLCKGNLTAKSDNLNCDSIDIITEVMCQDCSTSYLSSNGIIDFRTTEDKLNLKEGIAVDLENAINLFKREIKESESNTERLFKEELINKNKVFLDIGCGIGRHLLILKNNGIKRYLGFDIVPDLVYMAKKEYKLSNLFIANATNIPIKDETIDACLMYNVIEHCRNPLKVMEEIKRVLKKGGVLYLDVPNAKSMGDRIFRWGGILFYGKTSHIQKFTLKKFVKLVESVNLTVAHVKTKRGIFLDYPQLDNLFLVKKFFKLFWGNEISGWEFKIIKRNQI